MSELAKVSFWMAAVLGALAVPCLAVPARSREALRRLPRSRAAGWILAAADIAWVVWIVMHATLGRFEGLRPVIYLLAPVAVFLMGMFMEELLAPRALGALMLLIPTPVLAMVRWHESPLRLVVVVLCYVMVLVGMTLVLSPFQFRKFVERRVGSDGACRGCGAALLVVAAVLAAVGMVCG